MYGHTNPTIRTTEEGEQVGPKMHAAVELVQSATRRGNVYGSINQLAQAVGPNGSQGYGYRIVYRCRRKGLVELDSEHPDATPQGRGAVVITDKGKRYLETHE